MVKSNLSQALETEAPAHTALTVRPVAHLDPSSTLIQLAAVHLSQSIKRTDSTSCLPYEKLRSLSVLLILRFERFANLADLNLAIAVLEGLVRSPVRDEQYFSDLRILGVALSERFDYRGMLSDLENAISRLRDVVDHTHVVPTKASCLNSLGICLLARFQRLGELKDLEDAKSMLKDAVRIVPHSTHINSLGIASITHFERVGTLNDLDDAISTFRRAIGHIHQPEDDPRKPAYLNNLGNTLRARFECCGDPSDLEDAISALKGAVQLTPRNHPQKPGCLNNLGNSLKARFERTGESKDLEEAISTLRDAVDLVPHAHPHYPGFLYNFGGILHVRFEHFGELCDLDTSISLLLDVARFIPRGHRDKPTCLHGLGYSLLTRFQCLGELEDLENAISRLLDAIRLIPDDHTHKPGFLNILGASFRARFGRFGELNDLENAISALRHAVGLLSRSHIDLPACLNSLGNVLAERFGHLGQSSDLEEAISRFRDAVRLIPHCHPHRPMCLSGLGTSLKARFRHFGDLTDLDDAILTLRTAVDLTPEGHPQKPTYLNNVGDASIARFHRLGHLNDLEDAILVLKDAIELLPPHHPQEPGFLGNLGYSLFTRFQYFGERSDLSDAVSMLRDAVDLTPEGHPDKHNLLTNLGCFLRARFECHGMHFDLEAAILCHRSAVALIPRGHPERPGRLDNLGSSLAYRFACFGKPSDVESAISMLKDAVHLSPLGHPGRHVHVHNLGSAFRSRFESFKQTSDLQSAISVFMNAVNLIPHGHPQKPCYLTSLAKCFKARFEHLGEQIDLERALSIYSHAASAPIGPALVRFQASQEWISCAKRIRHDTLLHAYSVAIDLLPRLAWIGLPLSSRCDELKRRSDVVRGAAAAALDLGLPEIAVEWLEQGRSIIWGDLFQLRSSYEELSSTHPDHARRLRELSAALEHTGASREKLSFEFSEQAQSARQAVFTKYDCADEESFCLFLQETESAMHPVQESLKEEVERHRTLAFKREILLQEIRSLPGYERFLLRKSFAQLRASALAGPVVILNAAESRCDALIVLADVDHVIHVPLPSFTFNQSLHLQHTLKNHLRHARVVRSDEREGRRAPVDGISWESFLSPLWKCVVKPVLAAVAFSAPSDLSRIFWCPTGPFAFLPIHAAGLYDDHYTQPGHKIYDFVFSSYIPTLSILSLSHNRDAVASGNIRILAVPQPPSDGLSRLPGVATELAHIREVIGDSPSAHTTLVEPALGTVEEVLSLMKDTHWAHFACHGVQEDVNSGLCLADGRRLKITDVIALSRPRDGLAFLSACQTATGDEGLADEAIHVAAGMLFAGYEGVVGTMWSICDRLAPVVARDVYETLLRGGPRPDHREAARALHDAVGRLRESDAVSFYDWIPFIHVGL